MAICWWVSLSLSDKYNAHVDRKIGDLLMLVGVDADLFIRASFS